ncbi:hypothetical protein CANCADRAFT_115902 [Tortispora caseinolytica NRRL Y-17796]|uniref:Peptide hydrolase n=1 Tax=Tortispora caseinolytica NRRL Y-17796 TaxID=767744 RepID=A0A1E4TH43_9ASCO|nr:hypothetical protein CANCADRAFT_115902 [Tortispora caseinolytica NRRL Y-17796]
MWWLFLFFSVSNLRFVLADPINELRLIQTDERHSMWTSMAEMLTLKSRGVSFMDVTPHFTDTQGESSITFKREFDIQYPESFHNIKQISSLVRKIDMKRVESFINHLASFHTRFFKSVYAQGVSNSVFERLEKAAASHANAHVTKFVHSDWQQKSIIARIPGDQTDTSSVIVFGAHIDSINQLDPMNGRAPGADDDATGAATIFEMFSVFCESNITPRTTLEFHFYSAEEVGLRGSQEVFSDYAKNKKNVLAMVQFDMLGYIKKAGSNHDPVLLVDKAYPPLVRYIKDAAHKYFGLQVTEATCGYACSDHASANKVGYPGVALIEAPIKKSNPFIHSVNDVISHLDMDNVKIFIELGLAMAYDLSEMTFNITEQIKEKQTPTL